MAKTVIIGTDGVPLGMIKDFTETGVMPNTARVIEQGLFRQMHSSIPEVSSVAWSSMITGANPAEHGIFGFMELQPNSYRMRFPNYNDIKSPAFWDKMPGKSIIINVPSTYPVRPMNGVLISGFVSIDINKSVYPPALVGKLKEFDYRLDVDARKAHESMELFLQDADETLEARIKSYRYLWDLCEWDTFMLVFTGTDRLLHFLWNAYEDKQHQYHEAFLAHFRKIDSIVGEIADKLCDEDMLIMHSDHGFERLDQEVFVNYALAKNGFLQFKQDTEPDLENICAGTRAFALDPARIYLNLKGKYPCGSVEPSDAESILSQMEDMFAGLEIEGKKVIRDVYRKQDIYDGPLMDDAPDLTLVGNEGFNLKGKMGSETLSAKGIFTGKHTQDTAYIVVKGLQDKSKLPDVPKVSDITALFI